MPAWPRVPVPRETQLTDIQQGFAGGLNTTGDAFELQPDQMTRADNARLTQFGSATKRLGTQRMHTSTLGPDDIQGGFCWEKSDGTLKYLTACNGVFYTSGSLTLPMTWTSLAVTGGGAALSSTNFLSFVPFVDSGGVEVVFIADGGLILKYNGTTLVRVAATPTSILYLTVYNQRLFGISGTDQSIFYSALNDGETLGISPDGGEAVVRTFGDQKLTNILTLRDSLVLFHVTGISRFTGLTQDDIAIQTGVQGFSSDVGTLFSRSPVQADGIGYFMSDRGAYLIADDGVRAVETITKPDPTTSLVSALASSNFLLITGVHDRNNKEIRWVLPGTGVYVFNYRLSAWTGPWNSTYAEGVTAQWPAVDANGRSLVMFGNTDGFIRRADVASIYLDDVVAAGTGGSSFTFVVECHRMFTRAVESEKSLRWAYIFADLKQSTTAIVSWAIFSGSNSYTIPNPGSFSLWGIGTWGSFTWGGTGATRYRIPLGGRGPFVTITISDDGQAASVYSRVEVVAFDLGPRG